MTRLGREARIVVVAVDTRCDLCQFTIEKDEEALRIVGFHYCLTCARYAR
ncbi:hypothetical protein [Rhodococcus sp. 11-3]|nr:hypothetical protein [Rhodococcus sp. 11-3]USC16979.1 hypothetical protein KZJ41_08990 [Rhodococcus sp. 11-3]